jgi:hypothetical protein
MCSSKRRFAAATHGFVTTSEGIVMIDSPHKPSDGYPDNEESFDSSFAKTV